MNGDVPHRETHLFWSRFHELKAQFEEMKVSMDKMGESSPISQPKPPLIFNSDHRLPGDQYFPIVYEKSMIVLHHTVGGSAKSSLAWWMSNVEKIGTAYIIDRDGTIYVAFDPSEWAWHLGVGGIELNSRSIGIELASEGPLRKLESGVYTLFKNPKTGRLLRATDPHVDLGYEWRGFQYFDAYEPAQISSCIELLKFLLKEYPGVPHQCPADPAEYSNEWKKFSGIISHSHVRFDKSDVHPLFEWDRLAEELELERVDHP